ncbi:MAG: hypothetical protein WAU39_15500, partial [Polyangiales bacterium]
MKLSGWLWLMGPSILVAVLSWNAGCADSSSLGGGGAGGAPTPECRSDQECRQALGSDGFACGSDGQCFECEHEDPFGGPVETPAFWSPDLLMAGDDLGLDAELAYWELPLGEYGLQDPHGPSAQRARKGLEPDRASQVKPYDFRHSVATDYFSARDRTRTCTSKGH